MGISADTVNNVRGTCTATRPKEGGCGVQPGQALQTNRLGQLSIVDVEDQGNVCGFWGQASGWPDSLAFTLEKV